MTAPAPALRVVSFGTVHGGLPDNIQADHVHDVSDWFRDPNVSPELRELTGLDQAVIDSVMVQEGALDFVEGMYRLVLPQLMKCRRTLVTAIGCVGGRHRSVVFANELAKLAGRDWSVEVVHLHKDMPVTRRPKEQRQRDLLMWLHAEARWERDQALQETARVDNAWREVVKQWEQGHQNDVLPYTAELEGEIAALKAEAAEVVPVLDALARILAGDPRDWSLDRRDAWLWGVLCGWDCEDHPTTQECDETCTNALASIAERHGWNDVEVDVLRKMRATIREARRG